MTENQNPEGQTGEPKKVSLQEAIKRKLEQKKAAQNQPKGGFDPNSGSKKLTSQNTKKPNNQRRRTGGS
ncbi:hypothetical protein [Paenibacillus gansuensis]|uniref:Uncharacterized protein n=1 Tax=Paenibacillus gansuensis TaxID=306542 RepID=A0ABW5PI79_9BACL